MSQLFTKEGRFVPVTLIEAGPCYVLQRKTKDKDGYEAAQISHANDNKSLCGSLKSLFISYGNHAKKQNQEPFPEKE